MKVKDLMTVKVRTVSPEDKIDRVFFFMNFEQIRHLPVVKKGKVVGILSDRDLKKVFGSLKMNEINALNDNQKVVFVVKSRIVRTIMRRGVLTIHPNAEAYEAAAVMAKRKIGALPVVKNEKLVGIISATDILHAFVKLSVSGDPLVKKYN
ncbi:MAG: CBS domain-containing protein [Nitrospirae bacterium]|nr:CBS domain-containing protein [Nitrospirota bacterium]MBI3595194.1 CBS domain-containing protein [Nitrospirota bacterium]